jgi:hypothetical protein
LLASDPAPPDAWIHQLNERAMTPPGDHEMSNAVGQPDHHNRRQHVGFPEEHVVRWHHDLLGIEAKLHGGVLHRIDRRAVHIGLAGLPQPPVTGRNAKAFQQAFERGGAAVHRGRLDYFGNEETAAAFHGAGQPSTADLGHRRMRDRGIGGYY